MTHHSTYQFVNDIRSYLRPHKWKFIFASFCRAIGDIAWLYTAYGLAELVTFFYTYQSGASLKSVYTIFSLLILSATMRYVGLYIAKTQMLEIGQRISLGAKLRTMRHLFSLDISWHEKENSGSKFKKVDRGSESLDRILQMWINNFIEITINIVGIFFIIAKFDAVIASATGFFLVTFYLLDRKSVV